MPSSISSFEHTMIGALAGVTEVTIMHPTVALKNALQEGRSLPRTPAALYRGYLVNAGSFLPITAIQFGMNRYLEQTYTRVTGAGPGNLGSIAIALGAGSSSALVGCPAEFIMIQQQRHGRSLAGEFRHILATSRPSIVYRGLSATLMRESLYAAGYLGLMPIMRAKLEETPSVRQLPGGPLIISGLAAGVLATVTTQPADTIKTRMQAFSDVATHPEYRSMLSTAKHIVQTEGAGTLFAGLLPRAFRIIGAVFILTGTRNTVIEMLEKRKKTS